VFDVIALRQVLHSASLFSEASFIMDVH